MYGSTSYSTEARASYTISGAINSAIALLRNPVAFMTANRDTPVTTRDILVNYVAVLAAITFVATLVGDLLAVGVYGYGGFFVARAFVAAVVNYIFYVAAVFIVGLIIRELAQNFRSQRNEMNAMKLSSYIFTPFFIASIFYIIPFRNIGAIFAFLGLLYGLYILYKGLSIMISTPQDQVLIFEIVIVVVSFVIFAIIGFIVAAIFGV